MENKKELPTEINTTKNTLSDKTPDVQNLLVTLY